MSWRQQLALTLLTRAALILAFLLLLSLAGCDSMQGLSLVAVVATWSVISVFVFAPLALLAASVVQHLAALIAGWWRR